MLKTKPYGTNSKAATPVSLETWHRLASNLDATDEITRAIRQAVREAILDHIRTGDPIAEWKDGKVVWTPADQIELPPEE